MKLKRLNVPTWCTYPVEWFSDGKHDILATARAPIMPPVVGRDGWYYDRLNNCTWIEYKGVAYAYNDVAMFQYEVTLCHPHTLPRKVVVDALLLLLLHRERLSPPQKHALAVWHTWIDLREIKHSTRRAYRGVNA